MTSLAIVWSSLAAAADRDPAAVFAGGVVALYWWRVLRMAAKMRRRTGRAANFVPAEPIGRAVRLVWQPVVCLWIGLPLATGLAARLPGWMRPAYAYEPAQWAGVAVAVGAYLATRVCWRTMGRNWRMGIDPAERTTLIVGGPWAYVRHPIYALSSLLMLATLVAVPSVPMAVVAAVHLLLLQWEARREEAHLTRVHGPAYDAYRRAVGRFVPRGRRTPAVNIQVAATARPSPATPLAR